MHIFKPHLRTMKVMRPAITSSSITVSWKHNKMLSTDSSNSKPTTAKENRWIKKARTAKKYKSHKISMPTNFEPESKFARRMTNQQLGPAGSLKNSTGTLPLPLNVGFVVLGNGSQGTSKSVYLQTDHYGYIFNCGESIRRTLLEIEPNMSSKAFHLFITHGSWWNGCGLFEICLTLDWANDNPIHIHGCGRVDHLVNTSSRSFSTNRESNLIKYDQLKLTDDCLTIESVYIRDNSQPMRKLSSAAAFKIKFKDRPQEADEILLEEEKVEGDHRIRNLSETLQPVELSDRAEKPDDIVQPFQKSPTITVLDCPTLNHLENFINQSEELTLINGELVDNIIHLTPSSIQDNSLYQSWLKSLPQSISHMVVREDDKKTTLWRTNRNQIYMNMILPEVFPLLHPASTLSEDTPQMSDGMQHLFPASRYTIRPVELQGVHHCDWITHPHKKVTEYSGTNIELLQKLAKTRKSKTNTLDERDYPILSCLGTSSAMSTKFRNVSGYLLQMSERSNVLLDCGLGTYGQLERLHGDDKTAELLRNLDLIFISHGHLDHHLGLVSFLIKRLQAFMKAGEIPRKLVVVSPIKLTDWFAHLKDIYNCFQNVRYVRSTWIDHKKKDWKNLKPFKGSHQFFSPELLNEEEYKQICSQIDASTVETAKVEHAHGLNSYAIAITHKNGSKVAYSGDTLPCQAMVDLAKGADLLLHEATFGDTFEQAAFETTHSTISQAIDVGKKAGAKFVLLTHFSSRYPILVLDFNDNFAYADNVGVAFDNLVCRLRDLPNLTCSNLMHLLAAVYPKPLVEGRKLVMARGLEKLGFTHEEITKTIDDFTRYIEQKQTEQLELLIDTDENTED